MSRNVRKASEKTPQKKSTRKQSTSIYESSEDGYSGVDEISDSEEDEPDVEVAEEQAIMDDEDLQLTPRPMFDNDEWDGFDDDEMLDDDGTFFEEQFPFTGDTGATLLATSDTETDTRRVRFALSDSSSTMSNDEDQFDSEYPFPEFVDQSKLDPGFRRQIEDDRDEDRASSDGGYWDFQNPIENPLQQDEVDGNTSDSSSGSDESGYDTDGEGSDTEDEELPEKRYVPAKSVIRQPSNESDSDAEVINRRRHQTPDPRLPGPKLGIFEQKVTRPFAFVDGKTKQLLMFKAKVARRFSFNDVPLMPYTQGTDTFPNISPMISNTSNIMMNAMYNPMGMGEVLGPPEAFFPFADISPNGNVTHDSPSSFSEDDIEDLHDFFEDFVDFSSDDDNEAEEPDNSGSTDGETFSTPQPTTVTSEDQVLPFLSNPRLVGAFRTNQDTHRLLSGSNITADSMRFASRFHDTAITGIKNGHINAAATPITPLRKQKHRPDNSSPLASKLGSPLASKRKFDNGNGNVDSAPLERGHKRAKSMY